MLRVDWIEFNHNFFGSQAGSPEVHGTVASPGSVQGPTFPPGRGEVAACIIQPEDRFALTL